MASEIKIRSRVKIEEYLEKAGLMDESFASHKFLHDAADQFLQDKLAEHLVDFPGPASIEFYGWPSRWKIRIVKCPLRHRFSLWRAFRKFRKKLRDSPWLSTQADTESPFDCDPPG